MLVSIKKFRNNPFFKSYKRDLTWPIYLLIKVKDEATSAKWGHPLTLFSP